MNLSAFAGRTASVPPTVEMPWSYFERRGIMLDCRGPLSIASSSQWGFMVRVYTESHGIDAGPGKLGPTAPYPVTVKAGAWIGSSAILAGCVVGEGAIVAAGTVLRGQTVGPGVMVAGNPARVVARWNGAQWDYLPEEESGYRRMLS